MKFAKTVVNNYNVFTLFKSYTIKKGEVTWLQVEQVKTLGGPLVYKM